MAEQIYFNFVEDYYYPSFFCFFIKLNNDPYYMYYNIMQKC